MAGILFSLLAGIAVGLQGVFNSRASEKAGFWLTNAWVHGTGLFVSLVIVLLLREGGMSKLIGVNKLYLLGGVLGVVIVFSVMKSISLLGAAYSVAILFTAQIAVTFLIDHYGWFGMEKTPFSMNKIIGIAVMVAGIVIYKLK